MKENHVMGQYFKVFNLDKKEVLTPLSFHDGSKLMEFGTSSNGILTGLTILLRQSSGVGGGDFTYRVNNISLHNSESVGSWAGDRIAIVGDYDDSHLYFDESYTDISEDVVKQIRQDNYVNETFKQYEEMVSKWKN